jgi:hypothetical protein
MKDKKLTIKQSPNGIELTGRHFKFFWDAQTGGITKIALFDGINWHSNILHDNLSIGLSHGLPLQTMQLVESDEERTVISTCHTYGEQSVSCRYEIYCRGYVICDIEAKLNKQDKLKLGVALADAPVFKEKYNIRNTDSSIDDYSRNRAITVDFSTDSRPVTNCIDFMLETVDGNKVYEHGDGYRFIGWELLVDGDRKLRNRWSLSVTALDNSPNKVRGQRIYTYYGFNPRYPSFDLLDEMAEYGCSILHLHNWSKYISGEDAADEKAFRATIDYAHKLGMKVIFYCQPFLISKNAPYFKDFSDCRTEAIGIWDAMQDTQIVSYEPFYDWDCDELCLRKEKAYKFIRNSVLNTWKKYNLDGLYIDFAWPAQGLCFDNMHNHQPGLFNYYDYLRLLRDWRKRIGSEQIMIGHGGGFLTASDFVEAFDACLTGEAQGDFNPAHIGQQFGTAPTLWAMHRRKQDEFRSHITIEACIREGISPQTGVGIMGTSVIATLDPAHHAELIALWQMWRAFPVEQATFYNHLTEQVATIDNDEVDYSVYVTADKQVLILMINRGGPVTQSSCAVGATVKLDMKKLGLPEEMNCWRMKGNTYETFRIAEVESVKDGCIFVPELEIHEFTGFILTPNTPPEKLIKLKQHLAGRWERMPKLMEAKQKRLLKADTLLDCFAKRPNAAKQLNYNKFMEGRIAE